MNVLVTGGTGFVGGEIIRQLHNTGHRAYLLARDEQARATQQIAAQTGARIRPGNVLNADSLRNCFTGVEAVIHLAGIIREMGDQTFENVHANGTLNVIGAAQQSGVKRFLQMSALGTRPDAASRYHQSKWAAEEKVRRSGLGWTIFRPSIIYGPGDSFVNLFEKISRLSPVMPIIGSGRTKFQPAPVRSVATAFVAALAGPHTVGETYDLCGGETLSLDEIVDQILEVTQRRRLKLHIPGALARSQAALMEYIFPRFLHRAAPLNRDQVLMLEEDNLGNAEPAQTLFGLKSVSFREGIRGYLKR